MKKRSLYNLGHQVQTIGWMYALVPFMRVHVNPGDTFSGRCSLSIKLAPTTVPMMQHMYVHQYVVYTPYRLLWDGWEDFLAAGPNDDTAVPQPPTRTGMWFGGFEAEGATPLPWSAFALRAYNLAYNEFFRDDAVQAPVGPDTLPPDGAQGAPRGGIHQVAPERAYYNEVRPEIQTGAEATAPVAGGAFGSLTVSATEILRALAEQKLQMRRATYGTRYVDILRSYGVNVNYQMLQRPELVASAHGAIQHSDVLATGPVADLGVRANYGTDNGAIRIRRKSFPEHGILLGLAIVRPCFTDRYFHDMLDQPRPYEYYYDPGLEILPQTPITAGDVIRQAQNASSVIGYMPWGEWFRSVPNRMHSELADWVVEHFGNVAWTTTALTLAGLVKGNASNANNLFHTSAVGHYQLGASNALRAARLISRGNPVSTVGST